MMTGSSPVILMSSACFPKRSASLPPRCNTTTSPSACNGLQPILLVTLESFRLKAAGASRRPVPGLSQCSTSN
eukprot:3002074-Lingulodinium_polyedra.AAC.1